jgi:Single Cache domain 2
MSSSLSPLPLPKETEIPPLPCSKPANATHVKHWSRRHGLVNKGGRFHDRDLYITVLDLDGKLLAHGQRADLIGKVLIDLKDPDGKLFMRERLELARRQPTFWQDYKFMNSTTKKIEPKEIYCEVLKETAVCGGVYMFDGAR